MVRPSGLILSTDLGRSLTLDTMKKLGMVNAEGNPVHRKFTGVKSSIGPDLQSRLLSLGFLIHLKPIILLLSPKKLMLLYLKVRLDYSALFKTILQFS